MAAERGNVNAMTNLCVLHELGKGVDQSDGKAVQYYTMAAEQGEVDTMTQFSHKIAQNSK